MLPNQLLYATQCWVENTKSEQKGLVVLNILRKPRGQKGNPFVDPNLH